MVRPKIHDEEMTRVSLYISRRLRSHPEHASLSELVYALLDKYQREYAEHNGGIIEGNVVKSLFNEELRKKMKAFFNVETLANYGADHLWKRFVYHNPETNEIEYMQIVSDEIFQEEQRNGRS
jgi:hypothetical protein